MTTSVLLRAALLLTAAVLVSACGAEGPDRISSRPDGGGWEAAGSSFGVDQTTWPESMDGARALLDALPEQLAGQTRRMMPSAEDEPENDYAAASYGDVASVLVSDDAITGDAGADSGQPADEDGTPPRTVIGAQRKLGVLFGLGYGCAPDSYAANVPAQSLFGRPEDGQAPASKPVWFSCDVNGAEGDENFTAKAVGWTSSRTAWLVIARDDATARSLITSLHEATA